MKKRVRFLGLLIVVLFSLSGCAAAGGKSLSCEADGEAAPAPVPAPKLLDVETGALEITGRLWTAWSWILSGRNSRILRR